MEKTIQHRDILKGMKAYQADTLSQGLRKREEDIHDRAQVFH